MAAAPSRLGAHFKQQLTCSLCLQLFTRPKMLHCGHTFCQDCLQRVAGRERTFRCPVDRQQVRQPPQGVVGLPDNRMVANMCENFQQQTTLSGETRKQPQSGNMCSFHTPVPVPVLGQVTAPYLPIPSARGTGHHHGNHGQREHQPQKVIFGEGGIEIGQFRGPSGVTVSDEGEIFVADNMNQRIQVFTMQGTFVRQFPTVVLGALKISPHDVDMDVDGNLWVIGDTCWVAEFAVQYNKQGGVLRMFDLQKTGWDRGVVVDTIKNHILLTQFTGITPNGHGEVQVFLPDGTLLKTLGQEQGMKIPQHISVDGERNILVSGHRSHCVWVYTKDGQFLFQFGGEGSGEGKLWFPRGICTNREGNIIVADGGNHRVELFDKTGRFLKHITTGMEWPWAVAMAPHGQLVVTHGRHSVSIFYSY